MAQRLRSRHCPQVVYALITAPRREWRESMVHLCTQGVHAYVQGPSCEPRAPDGEEAIQSGPNLSRGSFLITGPGCTDLSPAWTGQARCLLGGAQLLLRQAIWLFSFPSPCSPAPAPLNLHSFMFSLAFGSMCCLCQLRSTCAQHAPCSVWGPESMAD